ncbi:24317_t:CDS:2, partial [Dentiscutata erythropus]
MQALKYKINVIDFSDFTNLESIGKGKIHRAAWNDCKTTVALKSFQEKNDEFFKELKAFIDFYKVSCHPNIIGFYGVTK